LGVISEGIKQKAHLIVETLGLADAGKPGQQGLRLRIPGIGGIILGEVDITAGDQDVRIKIAAIPLGFAFFLVADSVLISGDGGCELFLDLVEDTHAHTGIHQVLPLAVMLYIKCFCLLVLQQRQAILLQVKKAVGLAV
jgi:hypothetical protein